MLFIAYWKRISIFFVCLLGIFFTVPSFLSPEKFNLLPSFLQKKINLGLDLQGGAYLKLEVDKEQIKKEQIELIKEDIRDHLRTNKIKYKNLNIDWTKNCITFSCENSSIIQIKKIICKIHPALKIHQKGPDFIVFFDEKVLEKHYEMLINQCIEVIRHRIDETGTTEPIIIPEGKNSISIQLPGAQDPSEVRKKLGKTAKMTFHLLDETLKITECTKGDRKPKSSTYGVEYMPEKIKDGRTLYWPIKKKVSLSGENNTF